jgi:hypothetical protein
LKWYLYVLRSIPTGKHYIGITADVEKRLGEHIPSPDVGPARSSRGKCSPPKSIRIVRLQRGVSGS